MAVHNVYPVFCSFKNPYSLGAWETDKNRGKTSGISFLFPEISSSGGPCAFSLRRSENFPFQTKSQNSGCS